MNLLQLIAILNPPENIQKFVDFNKAMRRPLKKIINSNPFSYITIDVTQSCHSEKALSQCSNNNCRGNSILDAMNYKPVRFDDYNEECGRCVKEKVVDGKTIKLRHLHQDNTGYKRGSSCIWEVIHKNAQGIDRLVSGVHFSITVHIAQHFRRDGGVYTSNFDDYSRKYRSEYKMNLFNVYILLLSAISKIDIDIFSCVHFKRGSVDNEFIRNFMTTIRTFKFVFPRCKYNPDFFQIVDLYLDCIECGTCRLWGKIQFYGLEAALKAVRSADISSREAFYLLHLLKKISDSIEFIRRYEMSK